MVHEISRAAQARFTRLRQAWPYNPSLDWGGVEDAFYALSPEDQDACARLAFRYAARCAQAGRRVRKLTAWIERRGWTGLLEEERRAAASAPSGRVLVWVIEGTRAWDAWKAYRQANGKRMPIPTYVKAERGRGWWFPTLFPSAASASDYANAKGGT